MGLGGSPGHGAPGESSVADWMVLTGKAGNTGDDRGVSPNSFMKRVTVVGLFLSFLLCLGIPAAFAQDADGAHTKFDKVPIPIRTPPPQVPYDLKGQNGIVSVVVVIDEKGDVAQATVSKSTDSGFEQASIEAVKKWKFKPAEVGGQVVKAKITIPIHFSAAK